MAETGGECKAERTLERGVLAQAEKLAAAALQFAEPYPRRSPTSLDVEIPYKLRVFLDE